ncbi:hypothetical protein U1Q18_044596 [Sarracenia purpurea var. burkii]
MGLGHFFEAAEEMADGFFRAFGPPPMESGCPKMPLLNSVIPDDHTDLDIFENRPEMFVGEAVTIRAYF